MLVSIDVANTGGVSQMPSHVLEVVQGRLGNLGHEQLLLYIMLNGYGPIVTTLVLAFLRFSSGRWCGE